VPFASSWIYFPTAENPSNRYKYISAEFNMDLNRVNWNRQTYSLLDWLGDLGGLADALRYISWFLIVPFQAFHFRATILTTFFR